MSNMVEQKRLSPNPKLYSDVVSTIRTGFFKEYGKELFFDPNVESHEDYRIIEVGVHDTRKKILCHIDDRPITPIRCQNSMKLVAWSFQHRDLFNGVDLVHVCHGYARRQGARSVCIGNRNKDHFRRWAWASDVVLHPDYEIYDTVDFWLELSGRHCAENFQRMIAGDLLITREWGVAG